MTVMRISIKLLKEPEENGEGELAQSRDFFFFFSHLLKIKIDC